MRRWTRTLRNRLTAALITVVLVSVLLVGLLNGYAARDLLDSGAQDRLSAIGQARARSIEAGAERLRSRVSVNATDPSVATAIEDLTAGFQDLTEELTAEQAATLEDWYQRRVVEPVEAAGLGPVSAEQLVPSSPAGRYLQYHYLATRSDDASGREIDDAGDGSAYSIAHAEHHPNLVGLSDRIAGGGIDVLLVSGDGTIVYTVDKRIDLGSNIDDGPYQDSPLAAALRDQLERTSAGEATLADLELYLPAGGEPTLFMVNAVRRNTAVIGAIAVEVPASRLSAITTANGNWESVGLAEGESYVVGSDFILRSESRPWIEDPEAYLARIDDEELAGLIQTFGSPVGLQTAETEAIETALGGTTFNGQTRNYLGQRTFSSVVPIATDDVDWVVVVDTPLGEARAGLYDYALRLGIVLALLVPLAAAAGFYLADRLARPIPPVARAARAVAEGEREPELGELWGDEIGDLGRRLVRTAEDLKREEDELEAEFEQKRRLLLAVLPQRLVTGRGDVEDSTVDPIQTTTAIAVGVLTRGDHGAGSEADSHVLTAIGELADRSAAERGLERVRSAADSHLFLAGVGADDDGANEALAFAVDLVAEVEQIAESEDVKVGLHLGLSSGPVATAVLDSGNLTYGAWGEPVRRALAIAALSRTDEILIDGSTAVAADRSTFDLVAAADVISLDGDPMGLLTVAPASRTTSAETAEAAGTGPSG